MPTALHHEAAPCASVTLLASPALRGEWPWFAVRIREKFRAVTEELLSAQGITFFSPMSKDLRQWSDRMKVVSVPLFAGYLFCSFNPQKPKPILQTIGVIDIVRFGSTMAEVDERELDAISKAVQASPNVTAVPYLAHGQRVRVMEGPLRGVEGILTELKSRSTLVLAVTMMNRSVAVQIDRSLVQPM